MNIVAPIHRKDEVKVLIDAGADEFFLGILTPEWTNKYSDLVPMNKRGGFANLKDLDELAEIVKICNNYGDSKKKISLTLNSPYYSKQQMILVKDLIEKAIKIGISSFIVTDIFLIEHLVKLGMEVHVSTIAGVLNSEQIKFYKDMGVKRIILSRDLTLNELTKLSMKIKREIADLELEVFVLNDGCRNVDSHCTFLHGIHNWNGNFFPCSLSYTYEFLDSSDFFLQNQVRNHLKSLEKCSNDCAACNVLQMIHSGIEYFKISGRGMTLDKKRSDILFIRDIIDSQADYERSNITYKDYQKKVISHFNKIYGRSCQKNCYYSK
jgi:U32 family peptidase